MIGFRSLGALCCSRVRFATIGVRVPLAGASFSMVSLTLDHRGDDISLELIRVPRPPGTSTALRP